jgi:hypothetical protein
MVFSERRHIFGLAAGTDRLPADALELFAAFIAAVFFPLHPLIKIQVPVRTPAYSTHVRSPHYDFLHMMA